VNVFVKETASINYYDITATEQNPLTEVWKLVLIFLANCNVKKSNFDNKDSDVRAMQKLVSVVWAPDVWNSLPSSLRTMPSHSAFHRSLKTQFYFIN